jgi:N-methylhydantoinase B
MRDLARGYISAETAARDYGLGAADIAAVEAAIAKGEDL